jgi:hypothetical protein
MKKVYADDSLDIERQKFPEPKVPINITIDCDLVKKDTLGIDTMDVADDTIELDLMQDSNDDPF